MLSTKRIPTYVAQRLELLQRGAEQAQRLKRLEKEFGAEALGVSARTVQRSVKTQRISARLLGRMDELEERRAIQTEPEAPVPGYGLEKRKRLLRELGHTRAENAEEFQDIKRTIRRLKLMKLQVPRKLYSRMRELLETDTKIVRIEKSLGPKLTIEARLDKAKNIDREAAAIALEYGVSARSIYVLFFSPPKMGT